MWQTETDIHNGALNMLLHRAWAELQSVPSYCEQQAAQFARKPETCPVCYAANLSTDHLIQEYKDMMSARFGMFGRNAAVAQDAVATLLLARGITHIPNILGDIPIKVSQ